MALFGGVNEPLQLARVLLFVVEMLCIRARVQLDELRLHLCSRFNLRGIGRDEEACLDSGLLHSFARVGDWANVAGHFQSSFGGHFLAALGDEANAVWL